MEPETQLPKTEDLAMSFGAFKKALGSAAFNYSDVQIEEMRRLCDRVADAAFNGWLKDKRPHNVSNDHE